MEGSMPVGNKSAAAKPGSLLRELDTGYFINEHHASQFRKTFGFYSSR
jgi:hypothetical protein